MDITIFAAIGFLFAAYAVVGNDALQTLGTFINSNSRLHWAWLFLFAGSILVLTFTYGWVVNGGDPSWGRLANVEKYPPVVIEWYHTLPPLALLIITRFGVPVSTSFMVLTVFATVGGMTSMLTKSLTGWCLAFIVGLLVYLVVSRTLEKYFRNSEVDDHAPYGTATVMGGLVALAIYFVPPLLTGEVLYGFKSAMTVFIFAVMLDIIAFGLIRATGKKGIYWVILQWVTTGYLWGVWLIQDFANIFVFLPRNLSALECFAALGVILILLGYTFWNQGGPVQKILKSKTAVTDIRSATMIDFIYASLLFFFKEVSDIPMSTTFVFLGLIAGREFGFTLFQRGMDTLRAVRLSLSDASKAYIGLIISINMAVGLPILARALSEPNFVLADALPSHSYMVFIAIANLLLLPVAHYLMAQFSKPRMMVTGTLLTLAGAAFFIMPPT